MDCSMPGFPVHSHLPNLAQTHVHRVSDAIQASHPLSSPSPPAFNLLGESFKGRWKSTSSKSIFIHIHLAVSSEKDERPLSTADGAASNSCLLWITAPRHHHVSRRLKWILVSLTHDRFGHPRDSSGDTSQPAEWKTRASLSSCYQMRNFLLFQDIVC